MIPRDAPLFKLLSARLNWLTQRQAVLAQNIANADTPDYRPRDLRKNDFLKLVQGHGVQSAKLQIARTSASHLVGSGQVAIGLAVEKQSAAYETSPDGNAVILEEQTAKASQTALDHQLASNIYRKYIGMIKIALGSSGS